VYRLVERILDPRPRIGQRHLENAGIAAGFGRPREGLVDRIRHRACVNNARPRVVIDQDRECQLVPTVESHTDHEFVNIAEHIGYAHGAVDVDPRKSGDPSRQMLAAFGDLVATPDLCCRIVDEKFGDGGQKHRRLPIPYTDQAVKDPLHTIRIALVRLQRKKRFRFRRVDHNAGHAEQAERMPRQGTAYRVPERPVGRTFPVALLRPSLVTSDLFSPVRSSLVTHIADATHGQ
jgi:hypothetical protein